MDEYILSQSLMRENNDYEGNKMFGQFCTCLLVKVPISNSLPHVGMSVCVCVCVYVGVCVCVCVCACEVLFRVQCFSCTYCRLDKELVES